MTTRVNGTSRRTMPGTSTPKPASGLFADSPEPQNAAQLLERALASLRKVQANGMTGIGKDILAGLAADDISEALRLSRAARAKKEEAA